MKNLQIGYFLQLIALNFGKNKWCPPGGRKLINLLIIKDNFFIQKMQIFIKKNLSKIAKNGLIMNTLKNYKNTISLKLYFFVS